MPASYFISARARGEAMAPVYNRRVRWLLLLIICVGCGEDGPIVDCLDPLQSWEVAGSEELTTFHGAAGGAGDFGAWVVGPGGLPEYAYTLDQAHDPRADWPNSEDRQRRDHWHLVGNRRLNATVYNEGYVELYAQDRGAEFYIRRIATVDEIAAVQHLSRGFIRWWSHWGRGLCRFWGWSHLGGRIAKPQAPSTTHFKAIGVKIGSSPIFLHGNRGGPSLLCVRGRETCAQQGPRAHAHQGCEAFSCD